MYFRKGYRNQDELTTESPDPRYGFITNSLQQFSFIIKYTFNYIDIPLKCCLNLSLGKHDFIIGAGFVNSFLINSWNNAMLNGSENGKTSQGRDPINIPVYRHSFAPLVSTGIDFQIGEKSSFRIDLNSQYQLKRLHNDYLNYNLWSADLNFTYLKSIRKK